MDKIEYEYEYGFNKSSKIMEHIIGIDAARLLETLIYKYNYWAGEKKLITIEERFAFFITIPNLQIETNLSKHKISKAIDKLKECGLIEVRKKGLPAKNHYILQRSMILEFDYKHKEEYETWRDSLNTKSLNDSDRFTEYIQKNISESILLFEENTSQLHIESQLAETSPSSELNSEPQDVVKLNVTNNKNTKNNSTTNKKRNGKILTQNRSEREDGGFTEEEVEAMFAKYSKVEYNDNSSLDIPSDLYDLIKETRVGKTTPEEFHWKFVNVYLKDEFKGFIISNKDKELINDLVVNNPLFKLEDESILLYHEEIENQKLKFGDCSSSEINEMAAIEIDYDEDKYDLQYNMIWEKILKNYYRIKDGGLVARFGNIFVGIREMSENYALEMS